MGYEPTHSHDHGGASNGVTLRLRRRTLTDGLPRSVDACNDAHQAPDKEPTVTARQHGGI
jgi:hypothetical protein